MIFDAGGFPQLLHLHPQTVDNHMLRALRRTSILTTAAVSIAVLALSMFGTQRADSQIRDLGVGVGVFGGATKYYGEFPNDAFGPLGGVSLSFNPFQYITVAGTISVGQIFWRVTPSMIAANPQYFGAGRTYGDLYPGTLATIEEENQSRLSIFEVTAVTNPFPKERFSPFVGMGLGMVDFSPTNASQHEGLPFNTAAAYQKQRLSIPVLLGFNLFLTRDLSVTATGTYRFTNTEWLDDFNGSKGNDNVASLQIGLTWQIGGDIDPDKDGLETRKEERLGTDPYVADTDKDGLSDGDEIIRYKTDPLRNDTDGDGLSDGDEVMDTNTDPTKADTDNDGLSDGVEVITYRTNPLSVDSDNDRLFDGEEVNRYKTNPLNKDTDFDGVDDPDELSCRYQTNPLVPDTDGDGIIDSKDPQPALKCEGCGGGGNIPPYQTPPPPPPVQAPPPPPPAVKPEAPPEVKPQKDEPPAPAPKKRKSFAKDIRFKVNTDEFDFNQPETDKNLQELLTYMQDSCDNLQVMIEGHASGDGPPLRNKELSDQRARKVRQWLLEKGVSPNKIRGSVGYGSSMPRVQEPSAKEQKKMSKDALEAIRGQNRRIEIGVLRDCSTT